MMGIPLVSIICDVYNHAPFLRDTFDGLLKQQVAFPIEILVHDDASTDDSPNLIREYTLQYPSVFYPLYETENQFYKRNLWYDIQFPRARGKYIALCEGDDYWIDPLKLQRQVDYLEKHEECCMCTHAAYWETNGKLMANGCQHHDERDLTTDEVIRNGGLYLATASLIFRREALYPKPLWVKMADIGDYPLQILGSVRGGIHYFPQQMCVYRYQAPGSWTANEKKAGVSIMHLKNEVSWLKVFDNETNHLYSNAVYSHLVPFYYQLYAFNQISLFRYLHSLWKSQPRTFIIILFKKLINRLKIFISR